MFEHISPKAIEPPGRKQEQQARDMERRRLVDHTGRGGGGCWDHCAPLDHLIICYNPKTHFFPQLFFVYNSHSVFFSTQILRINSNILRHFLFDQNILLFSPHLFFIDVQTVR